MILLKTVLESEMSPFTFTGTAKKLDAQRTHFPHRQHQVGSHGSPEKLNHRIYKARKASALKRLRNCPLYYFQRENITSQKHADGGKAHLQGAPPFGLEHLKNPD